MEDVDLMNESLDDDVDLMNEELDIDERDYELIEPLGEMATVYTCDKPSIRIQVNPDDQRIGDPYFKVYDEEEPKVKETRVTRLSFLSDKIIIHKDKYKQWDLTKKDIKLIKDVLSSKYDDLYTVWDMTKWLWNLEYFKFSKSKMDMYMSGQLDEKYSDHPSYVPSTAEIPDTWQYNK